MDALAAGISRASSLIFHAACRSLAYGLSGANLVVHGS
jgi:hypothetical protein